MRSVIYSCNRFLSCGFLVSGALRNVLTASPVQCVLKEGSRTVHQDDTVMEKVCTDKQ